MVRGRGGGGGREGGIRGGRGFVVECEGEAEGRSHGLLVVMYVFVFLQLGLQYHQRHRTVLVPFHLLCLVCGCVAHIAI